MDDKDYLLTIRIPFKAMDDVMAREKAKEITKVSIPTISVPVVVKLQRQEQGKPPEGVKL